MTENEQYLRQYAKDRDEAILSLDLKKIRAFAKKYKQTLPSNEEVLWRAIHKIICHINAASTEQKKRSTEWLIEHGSSPDIF